MPIEFVQRSLLLTAKQWKALEAQAKRLGTLAPTGPRATKPSWRSLIKAIADGKIELTLKETPDEGTAAE
jgi:hypothetical protein